MKKLSLPPILAAILGLASISACSLGGGGGSTPSTSNVTAQGPQSANVAMIVHIDANSTSSLVRRPQFVATTTLGISVSNFPHGSNTASFTATADFSPGSAACTTVASGRNCTITTTAVVGNDDFSIATYDVAPGNGSFGTAAHQLGTAGLVNITIAAGQTNTLNVALGGIIKTVKLIVPLPSVVGASARAFTVGVAGLDTDNNIVLAGNTTVTNGGTQSTDTYFNPITLTISETNATTTGHSKLALNAGTPGSSVTVTKSSDVVTFSYDGGGNSNYFATVTATATNANAPSANVSSLFLSGAGSGAFTGGATPSVAFSASGQTETITLTEPNFTGNYNVFVQNNAACPANSVNLNTSGLSGGGTTFTLTAGAVNTTGGGCSVFIHDAVNVVTLNATANVAAGSTIPVGVPANTLYATAFGSTVASNAVPVSPNQFSQPPTPPPTSVQTIVRVNLADGTTTGSITSGVLKAPLGIAHDTSGNIYAGDAVQNAIYVFSPTQSGNVSPTATITSPHMSLPNGLAVDAAGKIYVADFVNGTVIVFPAGSSGATTPFDDIFVGFNPKGLALDAAGDIYVVAFDSIAGANAIMEFAPITTVNQQQVLLREFFYNGTTLSNNQIPVALAVDPNGNLFVSEIGTTNQVEEFSPTQSVAAGPFSVYRFTTQTGFTAPGGVISGIAVDGNENLYVEGAPASANGPLQYAVFSTANPAQAPSVHTFGTPVFSGVNGQLTFLAF
jgi:hypothetical protein